MPITATRKKEVAQEYHTHPTDTGSVEVQVALLTESIKNLTEHLQKHKKDHSSCHGLYKQVGHRSALLKYLKSRDFTRYKELITKLGIRK